MIEMLKLRGFGISFFSLRACEGGNASGLTWTKFRAQNEEKAQKENIICINNVYFFVKIRKKDTQMRSFPATLLCMKPILGSKTGAGMGLIGFVLTSGEGASYVHNSLS